jgi:hypothetical protein
MSDKTRTEPGGTWRERAGLIVLDPNDPNGNPLATTTDRRWLWRIAGSLSVSATNPELRQLGVDLHAYLGETCEHHWLHYEGDELDGILDQCLWCSVVELRGDAETPEAAR